jgi:uncharacterized repeat protein (TIGR01451 family)
MKRKMSWYWALPAVAGLALVMVASMLSLGAPAAYAACGDPGEDACTATPTNTATATRTPTATATVNPDCNLTVDKTAGTVGAGGDLTYTIKINNDASNDDGECTDLTVTDVVPDNTDCVTASVTDDGGLSFDDSAIQDDCDGASEGDTVTWDTNSNLDTSTEVVLKMVVSLNSSIDEGEHVSNTACATSTNDDAGDCDTVRVTVGSAATSTPQATATTAPIVVPTIIVPAPVIPSARPLPAVTVPSTGTGPDDSSHALAYGLAALGAVLVLASGAVVVKRTR